MNVGSHSISSDGGGMCVYTPGEGLTDTVTDTYLLRGIESFLRR
jgi:hypothetical protein